MDRLPYEWHFLLQKAVLLETALVKFILQYF